MTHWLWRGVRRNRRGVAKLLLGYFCLDVVEAGLQTGRCLEIQAHRQ